ncbi:peptidylprolyl isomerase [[Actinobacillus] muris]|uniref:Periplasmic chaperone PpiD n=1 Tax=Muribacter muris TaxID=67855 RepID=A0A0J5P6R4_9PAST|nr:SurA N-terminal domain-containing protein [Muribacter muris]KMK51455.1 peptidylprolyl isomerase [[Actinobacillus] muris] [Muribacter muris]
MIEKMHDKTNGPVFKVIFALVSLSFVLGGIGGTLMATDTSAVKVNEEEISQQQFNNAKSLQQNILNQQLGEKFWDSMDNPLYAKQFHDSIINGLVDDELLRQYAQELKLGISAEQIKAEIVNSPAFQQDGKFNNALYQQNLRNNGITADGYAAIVGQGMLFSQIQEGILGSHFSVPAQQALLAKLLLQKRQVRLATFPIQDEVAKQSATGQELQTYYEANKNVFINPEKLTVEYVTLSPADLAAKMKVSDAQIEDYYHRHKAQFGVQGESHIAHIQVADEATANSVMQAVNNGEDFATLAKTYSQDKISAAQGGDLGWAKTGTFPKAFEDAAAALQIGQVGQPVKVDGNFHIIKVLERKDESNIPLEQVKNQIETAIRNDAVLTDYANAVHEMTNTAFENSGSLEKVAEAAGVSLHKTESFTRENVPEALQHDAAIKALFSGDLKQSGQNSEAIEIGDHANPKTLFVRVTDYQAEQPQTFEQAKQAVENAVKFEKAEKALLAKAQDNVKALQAGETPSLAFAAPRELVFASAQQQEPVLARTVFQMAKPTDKATYHTARNVHGDVIVIALDKVTDGDVAEFTPYAAQFAQVDQQVLRQDFLQDLRERAKIEVNPDFIKQLEGDNQP